MDRQQQELLKKFQCDYNRTLEETFAQTLAEDEQVRLFFINENEAFTDGRNIVVDPAADELFADREALDRTGDFLSWPKVVLVDPWNALRIVTRAQTIHECLHLLYTDFPGRQATDPKCNTRNRRQVMGMISNIIEDAYIEAVGCSCFDNMEFYLRFGRVSRLFANHPSEGTVNRLFNQMGRPAKATPAERTDTERLIDYLNYMVTFLLYPMVQQQNPADDIAQAVESSKQLFLDGSMAASPAERYAYASRAFEQIESWIPADSETLETQQLCMLLGGTKTHAAQGGTISEENRQGRAQAVEVRLFTDRNGNLRENTVPIDALMRALQTFAREKGAALQIVEYTGQYIVLHGRDYDCPVIHKNIKINENHPKIDLNLRRAYQNIYNAYRINIRAYNSRFAQILKAQVTQREEKHRYGSGITSARLGDPQKRYWYRNVQGEDVPDLAVMLLIDGSGSMQGERQQAAMHAAVILHEVLKKQGIAHAVVEQRANGEKPEIDVNILVGFAGREEEKLNLMQLSAYGNSRDGLALLWAERYMAQNAHNEYRLLIVLSDGVPEHEVDGYFPPVSTQDTANAVKKITGRGTEIVGVSLDSPGALDTYEQLTQIYPHLVACNDLHRLTGQLLGLIAKIL